MDQIPSNLASEIQTLGKRRFNWLRRGASVLRRFDIDEDTIIDKLMAKGCTHDLAEWLAREALREQLIGAATEGNTTAWRAMRVLKALVALAGLINLGILATFLQRLNSYAILVIAAPFLMITSLVLIILFFGYLAELTRGPRKL